VFGTGTGSGAPPAVAEFLNLSRSGFERVAKQILGPLAKPKISTNQKPFLDKQ